MSDIFVTKLDEMGLKLGPLVREYVATGCDSEHDFDALIALASMVQVVRGIRSADPPDDPLVHSTEGWILGQEPVDYMPPQAPRAHISWSVSVHASRSKQMYAIERVDCGHASGSSVMEFAVPTKPGVGTLNIICGLNNSGKSLLLDQIYRIVKRKKHRGAISIQPLPSGHPRILFLGKTWTDKDKIGIVNLDQREAALTVGGEHGDYLRCGLSFMLAQMAPYLEGVPADELMQRVLDPSVRDQIKKAFEVDVKIYHCREDDSLVQRIERLFDGRLYFHCFRQKTTARAWQFEFVLAYEDGTTLPYEMWSDGQRACFYILVCLAYLQPEVVLFDELENHLHPAFISEVLGVLRSSAAQSIIATHHPHLIFSRFVDRVFYIETTRPEADPYPPNEMPFSARYSDFKRKIQVLQDDFARITAAYRLFSDQDDQLLRQANYIRGRATLTLVQALSKLFTYPPVSASSGVFPDTQTQQLAARLRAFTADRGDATGVEILDLGAGIGRQITELEKLSRWHVGTGVQWTCYEPIKVNRRILRERLGNSPGVALVENLTELHGRRFDFCVLANVLHELTPPEFASYVSLAEEYADQVYGGIIVLELFPLLHPEGFAVPYDPMTLQQIFDNVGFSVDVHKYHCDTQAQQLIVCWRGDGQRTWTLELILSLSTLGKKFYEVHFRLTRCT